MILALLLGLSLWIGGCAPEAAADAGAFGAAVQAAIAGGTYKFDHSDFDEILSGAVQGGLVDYGKIPRGPLDRYLARVADAPLGRLEKNEAFALLINAYNALTLKAILDNPQVTSIRDIPDVWKKAGHRVGGFAVSLDQLEHAALRPLFRDARVHFAINCASRSCAALAPFAFTAAKLDAQLDERRARFIRDREQVRAENGVLKVSSYFDWFKADFTTKGWRDAAPSVALYLRPHATPEVQALIDAAEGAPQLKILPYDWSLNAVGRPPATPGWRSIHPLWFGLAYVLAVVCLVPASPLTIAAGAAYGMAGGFAVVSVSATVAAVLAFLVARYLMRDAVRARLARWPAFANVDRAIATDGGKVVALARLSPVMPFTLSNYAFGVTGVRLVPYALATWIGTMPGTLLYVAMGAVSVDVATGGASTGLKGAGVVATAVGLWWLSRAAKGKLTGSAPASA